MAALARSRALGTTRTITMSPHISNVCPISASLDHRLTKDRCERFFDNDANFVLPPKLRESGVARPPTSAWR